MLEHGLEVLAQEERHLGNHEPREQRPQDGEKTYVENTLQVLLEHASHHVGVHHVAHRVVGHLLGQLAHLILAEVSLSQLDGVLGKEFTSLSDLGRSVHDGWTVDIWLNAF